MLCNICLNQTAVYHKTMFNNGTKVELNLCQYCVDGVNSSPEKPPETVENVTTEIKTCVNCGLTSAQFAKSLRVGCSECYNVFETELADLIEDMHGVNLTHKGRSCIKL